MDDGDVVGQLLLEDGVEVLRPADRTERVGVGQVAEDTDLIRVLKLRTRCHSNV